MILCIKGKYVPSPARVARRKFWASGGETRIPGLKRVRTFARWWVGWIYMIFKEMQNLCGHLLTEVPSGWFLACKSAARGSSTTCERRRVFTNFNHENARSSSQDETGGQKASRTNSHYPVLLLQLRLHLLSACPRLRRIHQELLPTPCHLRGRVATEGNSRQMARARRLGGR